MVAEEDDSSVVEGAHLVQLQEVGEVRDISVLQHVEVVVGEAARKVQTHGWDVRECARHLQRIVMDNLWGTRTISFAEMITI